MPRGKWTNHKGRSRRFTNPEDLEEERKRNEEQNRARDRRRENREDDDSSSENEDVRPRARRSVASSGSDGSESDTETDSDEGESKGKGVEKLIEISNPNRVQKKTKKLSTLNETLDTDAKPELTRREKKELQKQAAQARYQKLHAEGRTEEARADLARLAIIKAQREEAAMKRKLEKLQKEEQLKSKQEAVGKALGKKI